MGRRGSVPPSSPLQQGTAQAVGGSMTVNTRPRFALNRRSFLAAGVLPLLCPPGWLWGQQGAIAEELALVGQGPPKDPARTVRDYCLETDLSPETAAIIYPAGDEYRRIARDLADA